MQKLKNMARFAMVSIAAFLPGNSYADEFTFSSWLPATHPLVTDGITPWINDVRESTDGRIDIQMLPAAVASPAGAYDAVADGITDFSFIVHSYTPGRFPLSTIAELPMSGNSAEVVSSAYQRIWDEHLAAATPTPGVMVLANFTHGPGQIMMTTEPVVESEELSGQKIRVAGGVSQEVAVALGAAPISKPATESYEILSTGIADGIFFPVEATVFFGLEEVISHITEVDGGVYNVSFALIMNEASWEALDQQDREVFLDLIGQPLSERLGRSWDGAHEDARQRLLENGASFHTGSEALRSSIEVVGEQLRRTWVAQAVETLPDAQSILEEFLSLTISVN